MTKRIAIHITPAAERAVRSGHPWLFEQAIRKQSHEGESGDLAVIFDHDRRFLAIGLYDPHSPIRVKILQHGTPASIDLDWFTARLRAAVGIRAPLLTPQTDGCRLVHGENDGFPGLVVDRYADTLVLKLYTSAWLPHLQDITTALQRVQSFDRLVLRTSRGMQSNDLADGKILLGDDLTAPILFHENGLAFAADVVRGHKTGFFFDQRDNRSRVRDLSANRHVLDVFAYTGGFSVYAAAGGAKSVLSVDISEPALVAAQSNFALNQSNPRVRAAQHSILVADAFDGLEQLRVSHRTFDMVIVDPPSFAQNAAQIEQALAAYTRLTRLALTVVNPAGGIFVIASCSSRVTPDQFFTTVLRAASGYSLSEIAHTGHALDHPIGFPEGEYLKCLFATVKRARG
ncbi:MAG TPA: class I SAM-dependent rRNA methyltransferase [Aggregatilineaceae bacterium]|nr:class I SAM-dependent rRNA methyltransferase [Aggregatilineaceae bacterium]